MRFPENSLSFPESLDFVRPFHTVQNRRDWGIGQSSANKAPAFVNTPSFVESPVETNQVGLKTRPVFFVFRGIVVHPAKGHSSFSTILPDPRPPFSGKRYF